jgi:ATP/maltotriose-dependent transcriptional regulator MalT
MGLGLAVGLYPFWLRCGYLQEGCAWLQAAVEQHPHGAPGLRALALAYASLLAVQQDDYAQAKQLAEHSRALACSSDHAQSRVLALVTLGWVAAFQGHYAPAIELHEEAVALARQRSRDLGDARTLVLALMGLGGVTSRQGDQRRARTLCEEGLALAHTLGLKAPMAHLLNRLGEIARAEHDYAQAEVHCRQSLQLHHELGSKESVSWVRYNLGHVALHQHQVTQAATHFAACLALGQALGHTLLMANAFEGLGVVAAAQGQPQAAVRLCSAAVALRETIGYQPGAVDQTEMTRELAMLRAHLTPATFAALWTAGQTLPLTQALGEAAAIAEAAQAAPLAPSALPPFRYPADLTAREVDVLRLVAQGLTTPHIAARLYISPRTVAAHLRSIYGKLEVTSRSAATRFAVEHGLD